ncbi:heavy metal-associated isoprenylated plant protein 28 isoform X1 [Gossypium raimondii]|uniref:HMA domain-containing protein n=2 Tax=Gossypium raimondii TaxID=29730 RepID=A0A0D2QH96_GOSRA|nr:heavy metal-associated isoprenylated plant protein 28 isoform X1 [Gossypium raimondii]KJB57422.1 hypothetical protein B456_009G162900 [Gossypium raimondii]
MAILEMRVHMDCEGCAVKIKKALGKLKGVDSVDVDMRMQKVTVMGWAASDQKKMLERVRKSGKRAELWPYPYKPDNQFYYEYYEREPTITYHATGHSSSYNYYKHGNDGHDHGYYQPPPYSTLVDEQANSIFSDENPHACSIM